MTPRPRKLALAAVVLGLVALPTLAHAKANGIAADSCMGCHNGGKMPMVSVTADPMTPDPGGTATITVSISRTNGNYGGFYLTSNKKGTFTVLAGEGTRLASGTEVVHSMPKVATTGDVTFHVRWTAPAMKGNVDFEALAVSANGNNRDNGDAEGYARFSITYGCPGVVAYPDRDGDGYGSQDEATRVCELGPGFAAQGGDCNDNVKDIHPGATEVCNFYDDNCDGQINEGLPMVRLWRDADGDGHGARNTTDMRTFCGPLVGYATNNDDCDDNDPKSYPGAPELCDYKDNDCNGRVDDGARAVCGVGWCMQRAATCESATCVPGKPDTRGELCDGLDNDCNGKVDDNPNACPPGQVCFNAQCLTQSQAADAAAAMKAQVIPEPGPDAGRTLMVGSADDEPKLHHYTSASGCALGRRGGGAAGLLGLLLIALVRPRRR